MGTFILKLGLGLNIVLGEAAGVGKSPGGSVDDAIAFGAGCLETGKDTAFSVEPVETCVLTKGTERA